MSLLYRTSGVDKNTRVCGLWTHAPLPQGYGFTQMHLVDITNEVYILILFFLGGDGALTQHWS